MSSQNKFDGVKPMEAKSSELRNTASTQRKIRRAGLFALFVGPAFLAFALIVLIPFFTGMYYAFTDWNGHLLIPRLYERNSC